MKFPGSGVFAVAHFDFGGTALKPLRVSKFVPIRVRAKLTVVI
jgi:hypothetical protein